MEVEKSRNGFYTVTFINKNNLKDKDIGSLFSTVGSVSGIARKNTRVFVRFKQKGEAERAITEFGKTLNLEMAKNSGKNSVNQAADSASVGTQESSVKSLPLLPTPTKVNSRMSQLNTGFHLILGNLPKNYSMEEVKGLVEEAKPLSINSFNETKAFNIKFCHIVLSSAENLHYLIDKLDGFVICGQKLIALEAKSLLEWRNLKK